MTSKLQQIIRLLMILVRRNEKTTHNLRKGGLLILQSTQLRQLTYTVAAAGPWCQKLVKNVQKEATETLPSFVSLCDCPYPTELSKFSDNFGLLRFVHSFQVDQNSQEFEMEGFLYRFSLIHGQITLIFKIRKQEHWHERVFSAKHMHTAMGRTIVVDSATFGLSNFSVRGNPACSRMHPVSGENLSLFLPSEAVEAGLCGEVRMTSVAMIGPCMGQYPNWPTRISDMHIYLPYSSIKRLCERLRQRPFQSASESMLGLPEWAFHSPSGVPVMWGEHQTQLTFLQSLADSLPWRELGLSRVRCSEIHNAHGHVCPKIFSVDSEEIEPTCSRAVSQEVTVERSLAVQQTLFLFIFIQAIDPFHSQLTDLIANEEILEQHLDKILWFNKEKVKSGLQSTLEKTLKEFLKRKKSSETLQCAMSVMLSSVNSIVSCSSNLEFRSACLNSMKVQSTYDMSVSLPQAFDRVIRGRFVPSRKCTTEEAVEASVSEHACNSSRQEGDLSLLCGKRGHKDTEESPFISKRQCTGTVAEISDSSEKSEWERDERSLDVSSPPSLKTIDQHNQEVEREWLHELDNLTEWD